MSKHNNWQCYRENLMTKVWLTKTALDLGRTCLVTQRYRVKMCAGVFYYGTSQTAQIDQRSVIVLIHFYNVKPKGKNILFIETISNSLNTCNVM